MREIYINKGTTGVVLGHAGENLAVRLIIDTSEWEHEFPGGKLALLMERPDGRKYTAAVERAAEQWSYSITSADVGVPGQGRMQLQWMVDGTNRPVESFRHSGLFQYHGK